MSPIINRSNWPWARSLISGDQIKLSSFYVVSLIYHWQVWCSGWGVPVCVFVTWKENNAENGNIVVIICDHVLQKTLEVVYGVNLQNF